MFLPPKLVTILFSSLALVLVIAGSTDAQQAEFDRRIAAMQEARARAQQPATVRVVSNDVGVDYSAPPSPPGNARMARATNTAPAGNVGRAQRRVVLGQSAKIAAPRTVEAASTRVANRFVPKHTRTAQLSASPMIDSYSPVVGSAPVGCASCGDGSCGEEIYQGDIVVDSGCGCCGGCDVGCSSGCCGDSGYYFDECDSCCGRGGCPPGPCWLSGLGDAFRNAEYFAGATAFGQEAFWTPGSSFGPPNSDCSHGFYEGINLGIPLCRLSCGLLSGQIGFRAVQTNFNGNSYSSEDREQVFFTAGLYRRVDCGLQIGAVVDVLHEEWYTETDTVQVRGDVGWVYPCGPTLGFRFAVNADDDYSDGELDGIYFPGGLTTTVDQYRFYYRCEAQTGGYGEIFAGWSENEQAVLGLDFDLPVRERLAAQAGFTYYLNDDGAPSYSSWYGGNASEAYNIFVGFALRPRGRSHYRSYDRPLFSVADNGSMLLDRQ